MELSADTRTVADVFSPSKKYIVPRFQREFSWESEQLSEFWDDLVDQIKLDKGEWRNSEYFIGPIVLAEDPSKPEYLIIDGQQRLTTLTVLLRAIVDRFAELKQDEAASALYKNNIEGVSNDGEKYFKLQSESPKPFFQTNIQNYSTDVGDSKSMNSAKTSEEKRLESALKIFRKKLHDQKFEKMDSLDVVKKIRDQVLNFTKFIFVTSKNEEDAYNIFETLNARGISLSSVDLIKNWVFKNAREVHPDDFARSQWDGVKMTLAGAATMDVFFRHYWNAKYALASDNRLYKSFKDKVKSGHVQNAASFLVELQSAAVIYRKIILPDMQDWKVAKWKPVYHSLYALNQYKIILVRPFLLALLHVRDKGLVDETNFVNCIKNLDNFHFVFSNLCQERASGLERKYTGAAKAIHAAGSSKSKIKNVIEQLTLDLEEKRPKLSKISESLKKLKFSQKLDSDKKIIQTLFSKIEHYQQGTAELIVNHLSIEHVNDAAKAADWHLSLKNLIPLDEKINNEIGSNKKFQTKLEHYAKSNLKTVRHFCSISKENEWTKENGNVWQQWLAEQLNAATTLK